ncbi:30S ribosomal protein S2 [Pontibacter sp. G13]|uniref:30S ribosomal protein S2 n=1 Tax=Pontibacter sp. G13 TaxID=3074898 RepID=UPI00288B05EB|nr:30S ribosomal protein S2 [Pontibacter sp. G13]WNJ16961.1 30S ribosomal protein S2 [Pontibacter sp. G13]
MEQPTYQQLLEAGVHFGHLRKKWNPQMSPYIFMERNGIHIIDLNKTLRMLETATKAAKQLAISGRKIMFVATKKQAKEIVAAEAKRVNMPYVTERWLGGMLTNFATVRKSIKRMKNIEKMKVDGTFERINKKERLMFTREQAKLEKVIGGIADLNRLPSALFIVDIKKEHIAVNEARNLGITTIGMVDTNSNPNLVDFPIPANDDATKSIQLILRTITDAITEGLEERKKRREEDRVKKEADRQRAEETEAPADK